MKRDIVDFVSKCPNFQQVKVEIRNNGVWLKRSTFLLGSGNLYINISLKGYILVVHNMSPFG